MMPKAGGQYVYLREAFSPLWGFLYGWTLVSRDSDGNDRGGRSRIRPLHGRARAVGFGIELSHSTNSFRRLRDLALDRAIGRPAAYCAAHLHEHARTEARQDRAEHFHDSEDRRAHRADPARHCGRPPIRRGRGEFFRFLEFARQIAGSWKGPHRGNCVRPVRRHLRRANELALFCRRVEQYHLHRRRSGKIRGAIFRSRSRSERFWSSASILLANVAYLAALPFSAIQNAPSDRVASETANVIFPGAGATIMAVAIMVSTFGCNNGLILAGARAYYAMARDGLFFRSVSRLNRNHVPAGVSSCRESGPACSCCRAR